MLRGVKNCIIISNYSILINFLENNKIATFLNLKVWERILFRILLSYSAVIRNLFLRLSEPMQKAFNLAR